MYQNPFLPSGNEVVPGTGTGPKPDTDGGGWSPFGQKKTDGKPEWVPGRGYRIKTSDGQFKMPTPDDRKNWSISTTDESQRLQTEKEDKAKNDLLRRSELKEGREDKRADRDYDLQRTGIMGRLQQGEEQLKLQGIGLTNAMEELKLTLGQNMQIFQANLADGQDARAQQNAYMTKALADKTAVEQAGLQLKGEQQKFLQDFSVKELEQRKSLMESERRDRLIGIAAQMFGNIRF